MDKSKIGLIGLGVMGSSLARNIASKGFPITVYNRSFEKTQEFLDQHGTEKLKGAETVAELLEQLEIPRKIILMVPAGDPVDQVIAEIGPFLSKDDIIIDAGNSYFRDTQRRHEELKKEGLRFLGLGVSGGEEGALKGPSLMPGGDLETYEELKEVFEAIAARDFSGNPCVTYVGDNGAGHYVKMVHNGIEYAVMQIMAEGYDLLRKIYDLKAPEIADVFKKYNQGKLKSYLFEIASEVLSKKDGQGYLIDQILDKASQKGTGKWTATEALERGTALSTITEAVFARYASAEKEMRTNLNTLYARDISRASDLDKFIKILANTLYTSIILAYAQGYELIQKAAAEEKWQIDLAEISRIWQGGCIIRAALLKEFEKAFADKDKHLLQTSFVKEALDKSLPAAREVASLAINNQVAIPSISSALAYFDAMTNSESPANFIQGLRDYFGAHTYERKDKEGSFHTEWNKKC